MDGSIGRLSSSTTRSISEPSCSVNSSRCRWQVSRRTMQGYFSHICASRLSDAGHAADGSARCSSSASAPGATALTSRPPSIPRRSHGSWPAALHAESDAPAPHVPATAVHAATVPAASTEPVNTPEKLVAFKTSTESTMVSSLLQTQGRPCVPA